MKKINIITEILFTIIMATTFFYPLIKDFGIEQNSYVIGWDDISIAFLYAAIFYLFGFNLAKMIYKK